jgi:hypothetical protein
MHSAGKDHALAIIAAHPNIQVRLYNPFIGRSFRESPTLATEVARFIEAGMQAGNAYRVELDPHGDLFWTATEHGKTVHFTAEPHVTFWRSLINC